MQNIIINKKNKIENYLQTQHSFLESEAEESCGEPQKTIAHLFGQELKTCDFKITTDEQYKEVTSIYKKARDYKKEIEDTRKKITEPYRKKTSEINDKAKIVTTVLDAIIDVANRRAAEYLQFLEEQRRKKEEQLKEEASLFDIDPMEVAIAQVQPLGIGANLVVKKELKFRVNDIAKVPTKYLTISNELVERDLKLGVLEIPGIEIYEETTSTLRKTS